MSAMEVHFIKDERFHCAAEPDAPCRNYAGCECESWDPDLHGEIPAPGHEPIPQPECWIGQWIDATELGDTYVPEDGSDAHGMHFPDGPIDHEWDGDCVTWSYTDGTEPVWKDEA